VENYLSNNLLNTNNFNYSEKNEEKKEDCFSNRTEKSETNTEFDGIIGVEIPNKFNLNDLQLYWITRFLQISDSVGLTPYMVFSIAANEKNLKEMYLENLKKKLKVIIPSSKITAAEITHISEAFDINNSGVINFDDYTEMLEICKVDPIFSSCLNEQFNVDAGKSVKKDDVLLKKLRLRSSRNMHLLPFRGNTRVLAQLKEMLYSRANPNKSLGRTINNNNNTEENKDEVNDSVGGEAKNKLGDSNNTNKKNYNILETYNSYTIEGKDQNVVNSSTNKGISLINKNFIKNFLHELEVFENGEWYFIDILEDIKIEKNAVAVYCVLNALNSKLCPSITKKTTFAITKLIDEDNDGLITYSNLIEFMITHLNHTSVKLALKEMARVIELEPNKTSTTEFFKRYLIKEYDELNSVNFVQLVIKIFNLPSLLVKKLYYELKQLQKKDSITAKVLIDMIDEYREKFYFYSTFNRNNKNDLNKNEEFEKDARLLGRSFNKSLANNSINGINFNASAASSSANADKSLLDSEMKKLVKHLQKCFACVKFDFYNQNKIQSSLFKENLIIFLDLPLKFNLMQYRENFINSLDVNLSLGITLFNEIKNMQNFAISNLGNSLTSTTNIKNNLSASNNLNNNKCINNSNSMISRDDLINFITSYYDPVISHFDTATVVSLIEKNFSPLKCCFESIEYNPNGLVFFELIKNFEKYYPRIPKQILIEILKAIDSEKKGLLQYKNINKFLIKHSKNFKFSADLFFKEISAVIDKSNMPTFDFFVKEAAFANINQINDKVDYYEHNAFFFQKLKFNFELSDYIFVYLSEVNNNDSNNNNQNFNNTNNINNNTFNNTVNKASNNYNNEKNNNYEEDGYSFDKLGKNINFYRAKIPGNKQILSKSTQKVIDNSSQINKIYQDLDKLQTFFTCLNEIKKLGPVLNNLFISDNLQVSIYEIFKLLQRYYSNKIAKESLVKLTKLLDSEKKGMLSYESLYKIFKENFHVEELNSMADLHVRFIAKSAFKQFNANFDNFESFLNFKNLTKSNFLTYEEFKTKFSPEFYKDEVLMKDVFDKLKERKGKCDNTLNMQVFVDYLKYQLNATRDLVGYIDSENNNDINNENEDSNSIDKNNSNSDKHDTDKEKVIYDLLLSRCDEDFIHVFLEGVDLQEASILGKISAESLTKILTQISFSNNSSNNSSNNNSNGFLISEIKALLFFFSTIDKKFNLLKFLEWFEAKFPKFTKFSFEQLKSKAKENIPTNISQKLFFQRINIKSYQALSLIEFISYSTAVFKLSKYEAAYTFVLLLNSDKNPTSNEFKSSFDLFLNEFKLEKLFKIDESENEINNKNKEKKLDKFAIFTLFKFSFFLESLKSKLDLFKAYDENGDGVLSRSEFEKLLVKCTLHGISLNDMQITSIINKADKNEDGIINYIEFIEFLNQVHTEYSKEKKHLMDSNTNCEKIDLNLDVKDYSDISAIKNITTKYDTAKLKQNYEYNLKNFTAFEKQKISAQRLLIEKGTATLSENSKERAQKIQKLIIFYLQEEFIENLNKFIFEVSLMENLATDIVSFKQLWDMLLEKDKIRECLIFGTIEEEDVKENLLNFSLEALPASQKNKVLLEKGIHVKNFVTNVINFTISSGSGKDESNKFKTSSFVFGPNSDLGDMNSNMIKETIMNSMATKKRTTKVLARNVPNNNHDPNNIENNNNNNRKQIEKTNKNIKIGTNKDKTINKKQNVNSKSTQIREQMKKDRSSAAKNNKLNSNKTNSNLNNSNREKKKNITKYNEDEYNYGNYDENDYDNADFDNKNNNNLIENEYENEDEDGNEYKNVKNKNSINGAAGGGSSSKNPNSDPKTNFLTNFKQFATNQGSNEYDYKIIPEHDFYRRPDGRVIETILNSEEAAIKKCELLTNSLKNTEVFFDTEFGSQPNDAGKLNKYSLYAKGVQPRGAFAPEQIEWYRMDDISPDQDTLFINDGADSNDVIQGSLGDCWFISALSVLATKDHLLRGEFNEGILDDGIIDEEENLMLSTGVYPPIFHSFRQKKLFCFKFFKDFHWRWVIIDDRLPCRRTAENQIPRPIYARCKADNEFWVPLIEKAYAKLHGNYESLVSGFVDEGLVDLTGFAARKINITPESVKMPAKADEMWNLLREYSCVQYSKEVTKTDRNGKTIKSNILRVNNSMMGVSIDGKGVEMDVIYNNQKCGLLARHAYSILDTIEIPKLASFKARKTSRLLRIRNPWGTKEWKGKWCDESQEIERNKELYSKNFF